VHFGLQQRSVSHTAKKAMHECFARLKPVAGTPYQNQSTNRFQFVIVVSQWFVSFGYFQTTLHSIFRRIKLANKKIFQRT
jgi:hypothetical protein